MVMEGSTMVEPTHGLARNALGLPQVLFCIVTGCCADRRDAVQRLLGRLRRRLGCTERLHHGDRRLHRLLRRLRRNGPSRDCGRRLLQLHVARVRPERGDGRRVADRRVLHALRSRASRASPRTSRTRRSTTGSASTSRSGCGSSARSGSWSLLAFFHIELTAKILGVFLAIEVAALLVFAFATLFQPKHGLVLDSLLPWNFFDSTGNGSKAAFGAGDRRRRLLRRVLVMDRLRDGAELRRGIQGIRRRSWAPRRTSR